jgi:hypothetical protein
VDASQSNNRRRSERVVLHVPVVVVTETIEKKRVQEETHTLVVNAHGGLLSLKMEVVPGQPVFLINPRNGKEQKCHVVRVENPPGGGLAVAFEFDAPAPHFWPIVFPPRGLGCRANLRLFLSPPVPSRELRSDKPSVFLFATRRTTLFIHATI